MSNSTVVFIAADQLGGGDDELGRALMLAAVKNLTKAEGGAPSHILFMNNGVRLCCEGSAALGDLKALAAEGTAMLNCGTCLDWFDLKDALRVGRESNMIEILSAMNRAGRVVRL